MAWLSGKEINRQVEEGKIQIDPFNPKQTNPDSYDYRLGNVIRQLLPNSEWNGIPCIDPKKSMKYETFEIPESGFLLVTENAYLGHTVEKFGSKHFASLVTGKSSIGRLFIKNHACAGLIDRGFFNHITLEITAKLPTVIYPGMRFGQIFWFESRGDGEFYKGKYNEGDNIAQPSKIIEDWNK